MKRLFFIFLFLIIFFFNAKEVPKYKDKGFIRNNNMEDEVICLGPRFSNYANTISVPSAGFKIKLKGKNKFNIFKVDICQMDKENTQEIIFGVYKKSPHHRVMAKRIFIYNFTDKFVPKYRSSRLSKPLLDYMVKKENISKIYAILKTRNSKNVEVYIYDKFSFKRIYTYNLEKYEDIKFKNGNILVKDKGRWKIYEKVIS